MDVKNIQQAIKERVNREIYERNNTIYRYNEIGNCANKYKITKVDKNVGLMCPFCYNIIKCKIDYMSKISVSRNINDKKKESGVPKGINLTHSIIMDNCPKCKDEFVNMIIIDYNISEIIGMLNTKGYTTKFCCEGHDDDDNNAYIYFSNLKQMMEVESSIPSSWYIDIGDLKNGIFIIRRDTNDDKDIALLELLEWVQNLPDISNNCYTAKKLGILSLNGFIEDSFL